jgi:pimeloyl-ACP methyl ester carboxylesterase
MFVLVHGAWHGRWCWEAVQTCLDDLGLQSISVDLPGRGDDMRRWSSLTLADYTDTVIAAVESAGEPVTLVGHSLGGLTVSQVAERVPDKLSSLVYLAAMLLKDGQSTVEVATSDTDSELMTNISLDESGEASTVAAGAAPRLFFGDCTKEVSDAATARLVPEPIVPSSTPVQVTPGRWGAVPRSYIVCEQDLAITPAAQRAMIAAVGVDRTVEMQSGHSPFLSQPAQLADILVALASS